MRPVVLLGLGLFLCTLFLTACAVSERVAIGTPEARLFTALHAGEVTVASTAFDATRANALIDLVREECPNGLSARFTRTVLAGGNDTLVIYTIPDADAPVCMVYKPARAPAAILRAPADAPDPEVALTVNGAPITAARIRERLAATPVNTSDQLDAVIQGLLDEELLRQAALAIEPSEEDLAAARIAALDALGATEETLDAALATAGVDRDGFDAQVRTAAAVSRLLRERLLLDEVEVTDADAQAVYLADPNRFVRSEQAVMRAITIASDGRTLEEGERLAREVADRIPAAEFCALVRTYSDDAQTRENCGVYVIPRGVVDARLEAAAFGTPVNKTAVVVTDTGIYFVQTLQILPQAVVPYADVSVSLRSSLRDRIVQERLFLYLAVLRSQATVVSYLG